MAKVCVYQLLFLLLVGPFIGCGGDEELPYPAVLVKATPRNGGSIPANGVIALEFNKKPENLKTVPPRIFYFANEVETKVGARHFANFSLSSIPIVAFNETVIIFPAPIRSVPITVFWGRTVPQKSVTLLYAVTPPL